MAQDTTNQENVKIVKKLYDACMAKDFDTIKMLVHENYTLKDPLMQANGVDELIEMIKQCPSDGTIENLSFIAQNDKVVGVFDALQKNPPSRMRMCSIVTLENKKIRSEEMFYDTAQIPKDMLNQMKQKKA